MGEPWIELAVVEVRVAYDRSVTGDMVVSSRVHLDSGEEHSTTRRVRLGGDGDLERCWDRVFDEVLRVQRRNPHRIVLRMDGSGMGDRLSRFETLVRLVAYELNVPLEEAEPTVSAERTALSDGGVGSALG